MVVWLESGSSAHCSGGRVASGWSPRGQHCGASWVVLSPLLGIDRQPGLWFQALSPPPGPGFPV